MLRRLITCAAVAVLGVGALAGVASADTPDTSVPAVLCLPMNIICIS